MNFHRLKLALGTFAVLGMSGAMIVEHQVREKLDVAHESLTQQILQLKADNKTLSNLAAQGKKSTSLPNDQFNELLRLRGEVGVLREQTNEIARLQREIQKPLSSDAVQSETANLLAPADQYTLRQTHVQNAMDILLAAAKSYAASHDGQNPVNFDQLIASGNLGATNFPGNIALDDFEFMKAGTTNFRGRKVILRNRVPIPKPDEEPVWLYGSIDGTGGIMTTAADFANGSPNTVPASSPTNQ